MAENDTATTKAMRLGATLRRERELTGISLSAFAPQVGLSKSQLSRIENGLALPKEHELGRILGKLEITGERYDEIVDMLDGADAEQWVASSLADQARQHAALVDFEQKADTIFEVAPLLLPGIVQTDGYARAIMSSLGTIPPDQINTRVATRLGRRAVINPEDRPEPAKLVALIGQPALRRVIGDPDVMIQQLEYLKKIGAWDNVQIRLTADEGWYPDLEGAFTLIEPRDQGTPVVFLGTRRSGLILHTKEDVAAYRTAVELVMQAAMSPAGSAELIAEVIHEMRTR